ncbi:MAG: Dihydroorotate dehydrogenase [Armatimonadota bacterium]|jgi:dihydroorotate dehydrogenase (NAD+) catalytic subunit
MVSTVNMSVQIGSLTMRNPVTTGSGTFGFGSETKDLVPLDRLGAVTVKATTREPRLGNPPQRIAETASGILNAIGLQNGGIDDYLANKAPYLRGFDCPIIVNVPGENPDDFAYVVKRLTAAGAADAVELNISCPNVSHGLDYATDPELAASVVAAVRKVTQMPVIAKLSPNVTDIRVIAKACEDAGADALSMINTVVGTAIDPRKRRFRLANITGGLSGPAIKPVALLAVWRCYNTVKIPIIGMGGIACPLDAIEFMLAGATAVACGTGNFVDPTLSLEVIDGIEQYCVENGFADVNALIGAVTTA